MGDVRSRVPVVAGLAYREQLAQRPSTFEVTLVAEPENRYFPSCDRGDAGRGQARLRCARGGVAVFRVISAAPPPLTCPARRGARSDHETSGIELLLDFSALPEPA